MKVHREVTRPILVLAAMRSEIRPFLRSAVAPTLHHAVTGIGTARAETAIRRELDERPEIERVVMIGIAGGVGPLVGVGDLVVPETVIDARSGAELHPDPFGAIRSRHVLHTSDEFVNDPVEVSALIERGVVALDMETAAVGAVCEERGVPWSVIRGISDHAEHLPVDPAVLDLTDAEGRPNPAAVARYVVSHPLRATKLRRLARGTRMAIAASTEAVVEVLAS